MIIQGDSLKVLQTLEDESVNCCVTSPPYWRQRDYGFAEQIGTEPTPQEYVDRLIRVFMEVHRVLCNDGVFWLNIADTYIGSGKAGSNPEYQKRHTEFGRPSKHKRRFGLPTKPHGIFKAKDLAGIPFRVALALHAEGWYFRDAAIWHKPNPMSESTKDRCTRAYEFMFMFTKQRKYFCDRTELQEPTVDGAKLRNKRNVWTHNVKPFQGAHFATYPPDLIESCVKAFCPKEGIVLDPFGGAGTTALVAFNNGRYAVLIEHDAASIRMARKRLTKELKPEACLEYLGFEWGNGGLQDAAGMWDAMQRIKDSEPKYERMFA